LRAVRWPKPALTYFSLIAAVNRPPCIFAQELRAERIFPIGVEVLEFIRKQVTRQRRLFSVCTVPGKFIPRGLLIRIYLD